MPKSPERDLQPLTFRVRQVQQLTGLSRAHIYNLVANGTLPRCPCEGDDRVILIRATDVYAYLGIDPAADGAA